MEAASAIEAGYRDAKAEAVLKISCHQHTFSAGYGESSPEIYFWPSRLHTTMTTISRPLVDPGCESFVRNSQSSILFSKL